MPTSLTGFYVGAAIGGIGVGCVYATCDNSALKVVPGQARSGGGLTAAGYGSGTVLTIMRSPTC